MKLIKRTARSHWALRPLASLFSKSHKKVDDMATENSKKKNVSSAKINQPGQRHYPPPPPRSVPLATMRIGYAISALLKTQTRTIFTAIRV